MTPALFLLRSCIAVTLLMLVVVDAVPTYVPSAWLPADTNHSTAITQRNATATTVQYNVTAAPIATANATASANTTESGRDVGDGSVDSWPSGNSSSTHSITFKTLDEILALLRDSSSSSSSSSVDGSSDTNSTVDGSSASSEADTSTSNDQDTASDDEAIKPPKIELPRADSSSQARAVPRAAAAIASVAAIAFLS